MRGGYHPPAGQVIHGSLGDSAPDTWGRRLMQRAERRQAEREGRAVRTLMESDYLLGVADETRLGALRFRPAGGEEFLARPRSGVPALVKLGALLESTERILRDEETDDYRIETWEEIALRLAEKAGIRTAGHELLEVAGATSRWREVAREVGAPAAEIDRMASAFEHDDLHRALTLS